MPEVRRERSFKRKLQKGVYLQKLQIVGEKRELLGTLSPQYMRLYEREKAMTSTRLSVVQMNCQRAYAVMCDLSQIMCVIDVTVALL